MPDVQSIVIKAGSVARLNAIRASVTELRSAGAALTEAGMHGQAREVLLKAKVLAAATVTVPVPCLLCGERFRVAFSADGPATVAIGTSLCGPCSSAGVPGASEYPVVIVS